MQMFCTASSRLHEVHVLHGGSYVLSSSYRDLSDGSLRSSAVAARR